LARPAKQGLDYFPHDTDAGWGGDDKTDALIMLHGIEGYGIYFLLLERIYRSSNLEYEISATETGEENRQIFREKFHIPEDKLQSVLSTCLRRGLFNKELYDSNGVLTSDAIKRRSAGVLDKREKAKKKYQKVSATETGEETPPETPERKEKEKKRKEEIKNIYEHWNQQGIIVHQKLTDKIASVINAKLEDGYSLETVKDAVSNYSQIISSQAHFFQYRWTLPEFLSRGLDKFKTSSKPHENFLKRKEGQAHGAPADREPDQPGGPGGEIERLAEIRRVQGLAENIGDTQCDY